MRQTTPKNTRNTITTLVVCAAAVLMILAQGAHADGTQKRENIRQLIMLNGAVQSIEDLQGPMSEALIDALKRSGMRVTSATGQTVQGATSRVVQRRYDMLIEHVVTLYDRAFSEQEIAEILAFSKTSAGQRFANAFPALHNRSVVLGQQWTQALQTELRQEVADAIRAERNQSASAR